MGKPIAVDAVRSGLGATSGGSSGCSSGLGDTSGGTSGCSSGHVGGTSSGYNCGHVGGGSSGYTSGHVGGRTSSGCDRDHVGAASCHPGAARRGRKANPPKAKFFYQFNPELKLGVRRPVKGGAEEASLPLAVGPKLREVDFVVATWPDGDRKVLSLTQKQLAAALSSRRADPQGPLLQNMNPRNHNNLSLCQRTDRVLLLSLYAQSKQIVQFRVDRHGRLPPTPQQPSVVDSSEAAVVACAKFAIPICEMYVSGECKTKKQLQKARDKSYKDQAIPKGYLKVVRTKAERLRRQDAADAPVPLKNQ